MDGVKKGPVRIVPSPDDLHAARPEVVSVAEEHSPRLSSSDRVGLWVIEHAGRAGFFGLILGWTVFWLSWENWLVPAAVRVHDRG